MTTSELRAVVSSSPARSAWARGVRNFAETLLDNIETDDALASWPLLRRALLNGAADWKDYSYGGCAFIYNEDIARALCTPSELRRTDGGRRRPNGRESWLDVQARALFQAARLIGRAWKDMARAAAA